MAGKKKEAEPTLFRLTLTEKQLRVVMTALDWFFRLQMGQFFDYTTEIALNGYVYDANDPENSEKFDQYINRRNDSQEMFEKAFRIAQPVMSRKTEDMIVSEDVWRLIRYFFWQRRPEPKPHYTVDAYPPMFFSDDGPYAKVEEEKI